MANTLALDDAVKSGLAAVSTEQGVTFTDDKASLDGPAPADASEPQAADDKKPEKADEKKIESKQESAKPGLSEDQIKEATQLYSMLKDPAQGPAVLDWLARQAGYDKVKVETKTEVQEVKHGILEDLKESFGPELEFLADKLAPALEKVLNKKLEENTQDIRDSIQQAELEKLTAKSDATYKALSKDFFQTDEPPAEVTARINELIDEMPPSKGMTIDKYMTNLFHIAVGEKGLSKKTAADRANTDRANRNRTDAASRLASERVTRGQEGVSVPKSKMSLTDSVTAAMEAVNAKLSQ
jgi:hypothetical protein